MIPGFRYIYILRKLSECKRKSPAYYFFSFLRRRYSFRYGFQIPPKTDIGEGFLLGHFGTVVINGNTKIGKNCTIAHTITIGQTSRGKMKGCPTLGNNVWVATGSVIVGKVKIGNNVFIAPNSFVNIDVTDNSLVLGNPCKIIPKENPLEGYLSYVLK